MTDFREMYKRVGYDREDPEVNRALRSQRFDEARREMRSENFSVNRNMETDQDDTFEREEQEAAAAEATRSLGTNGEDKNKLTAEELRAKSEKLMQKLKKWQEEKNRQKLQEKKRAKPVFKVGVVHHRVYSPPLTKSPAPVPPTKLCKLREAHIEPPKRVTRATEKRLAVKAITNLQKRENMRNKKTKVELHNQAEVHKVPLVPKDHQFRAPVGITPLPMFGRHALEASQRNEQMQSAATNVTSTTDVFLKSFPDNPSEMFSSAANHSFILSKSTSRRSNLNKSNTDPCDSSTKQDFHNSVNNSSIETMVLKMSSDDQEILDNQENFNSSYKTDSSFTKYMKSPSNKRRCSRIFTPIKKPTSTDEGQLDTSEHEGTMDNQGNIESNSRMDSSVTKNTESPVKRRRSSRIFASPVVEANSTNEKKITTPKGQAEMENQEKLYLSHKNTSFSLDSTFSMQNKTRRSSRNISASDEPIPTLEIELATSEEQQMLEDNKGDSSSMDATFSKPNKSKSSTSKRRSTRMLTPVDKAHSTDETKMITSDNQEKMEGQEDLNLSQKISLSLRRRSTKIIADQIASPEKSEKETSFVLEDQEMLNNQENMDCQSKNTSMMDSSISKQNERKLLGRRSTRSFIPTSTNESFTGAKETSFSSETKTTTEEDQEMLENQENIDINSKNLMDSTFVKDITIKTPGKSKSMRFTMSEDQSLIKFSPRHSVKPQPQKSPKRLNLFEITTTTKTPESAVNESVVKFSPFSHKSLTPKESLNESSSSEPTKRKTPEKSEDNSQNFSLNLSLPKESTPDKPPAFFSPYIVMSRGKSSVRKEVQRRRFSQHSSEEIPTKDTVMQNLNISIEDEERTSKYYKFILDREIERLNECCGRWNVVKQDSATPEEIQYEIQAAVGQTQLLINKKFERFRSLVLDCETGKGEMLVNTKDLQGFWDMMYMEIKDCDNRFNRLDERKSKNWAQDEEIDTIVQVQQPKKKKAPVAKKPAAKNKPAAAKSSSLRAHIMAARKKKMENKDMETNIEMKEAPINEQNEKPQEKDDQFKEPNINSPTKDTRRTSTPKSTNKWQSLLKKVQLSQGRRSTTSPLILMKLSQRCKTPEVHLDDSIVYINSDRTPAKSILKTSKDEIVASITKSSNKVFFKEQPSEIQEIERNDEVFPDDDMYLDNIDECKEPIERKLDFDSDSFNSSHIEDAKESEEGTKENHTSPTVSLSPFNTTGRKLMIPKIVINSESPLISISPLSLGDSRKENSITKKNVTKTKKHISFKEEDNESYTRTLRRSKFYVPLTPKPKLRNSVKETDESCSMEVDDSIQQNNDSPYPTPEERQVKELYLNTEGIICERIIPVKKDTPRISKLKRSNSEKTRTNKTLEIDTINDIPTTPRLRRKAEDIPEILISSPDTPIGEIVNKSRKSSTPRLRNRSSKRSLADITLTEDNVNVTVEEATTPKLSRTSRALSEAKSNIAAKESIKGSATSKLRRTKSLNVAETNSSINESVKESVTPKLKRTNSKSLSKVKNNSEENSKEVSAPSLRRRILKKLQENVEPNEQETDKDMSENVKVSRMPSLKKSLKRYTENIVHSKSQTDVNKIVNEAMTPNTRRKSLRIANARSEH